MKKRLIAALLATIALALALAPAAADQLLTGGVYSVGIAGSVLTRAANTTAYTATSAAPQTVCAFASGTVCAPGTISMGASGGREMQRVGLLKSGSSQTNATFIIWLYSAPPGVASPSQYDATTYTGPRAADFANYLGNAACTTPTATSDTTPQTWYECTLSNPNTGGAIPIANVSQIYYLITVTGAYTPVSGETFTPVVGGFY